MNEVVPCIWPDIKGVEKGICDRAGLVKRNARKLVMPGGAAYHGGV